MEDAQSPERTCGECTVCCDGWLHADILGHHMGDGVPCHFLRAGRCSIYQDRPNVCRSFYCGWRLSDSRFPEEWRPDKAGFFIQPGEWDGGRCWLVHHAGRDPGDEVLAAMREHTKSTGEPHVIVKKASWLCYGKPEFQRAMIRHKQGKHAGTELTVNFLSDEAASATSAPRSHGRP